MKKINFYFLAFSCALFWSCSQPSSILIQNDTVTKLATPSVEGIAYPGVNYIYWNNIQNAFNGYDLRVYRKDNGKEILVEEESKHFSKDETYFKDTNISDGEIKRYEIIAAGDTAGRSVYYTESSSGSVSLTGILPNLSTSPLDLEKSEKGYNPAKTNTLAPENIKIEKNEQSGTYRVSFPVKPYLKYKVYADYGNTYEITGVHDVLVGEYSDISAPLNSTAILSGTASTSTYKVTIEVNSINDKYIGVCKVQSSSTFIYEPIISRRWIAADTDELANDLEVIVKLGKKHALSSIKYATAATENKAKQLAANGKALEFEPGYPSYVFILNNVGDTSNKFTAIEAVVSEEGKNDNCIVQTFEYTEESAPVTISNITFANKDNDGRSDDVYFNVSSVSSNQTLTVKYAVSKSASTAETLLETSDAQTLVENLSGYKFYEFAAEEYEALKNIEIDNYFAVKVIASEVGKADKVKVKVSSTCSSETVKTSPATINVSWKALDSEESIANDLHAIIETEINQTISGISYATATKEEYAANSSILNNRLNSKDAINVEIYNISELYRTEDKIVYEFIKKDFDIGTYLILKVTTSENAKLDNDRTKTTSTPVIENIVEILDTAQPVISDNLKFTSANSDSNFNDIRSYIDFRIDVSQKIESITYVYAETIEKAKELLISTSYKVWNLGVPQEYYLETSVQNGVSKLTKRYKSWAAISDVPAGNYVVLAVKVSQPGYNSVIKYVYTEAYYNDYAGYNVPAVATQREITSPVVFKVDDNKNYEYVKLVLQENYPYDSQSNYEYTLQRTLEKYYQEDNPIWEDISLDTTVDYGSRYEFYYADIPVGTYVYRLTKTRIATGESVVLDRKVVVSYHVDAPAITIGSYENGNIVINSTEVIDNRYDRIDKYDYSLELVLPNWMVEKVNYSWTVDSEYFDENFTQYKLNATITDFDAIISKYNLYDWGNPLNINVRLTKTRTITNITDSESTNFYASKGISATVDNSIPTLELTATGNYFAATNGFDSYTWYVNGTEYIADGFNVTIPVYNFSYGQNTVMVVATKDAITTSASVNYTRNR